MGILLSKLQTESLSLGLWLWIIFVFPVMIPTDSERCWTTLSKTSLYECWVSIAQQCASLRFVVTSHQSAPPVSVWPRPLTTDERLGSSPSTMMLNGQQLQPVKDSFVFEQCHSVTSHWTLLVSDN